MAAMSGPGGLGPMLAVPLTIVASVLLWMAGAVFFDAVHWVLHGMLHSRWRVMRVLAWPHSVHHAWLDRTLRIDWALQRANVWCHLVPEFLTQLGFSVVAATVVPVPIVMGCVVLQSAVFVGLLCYRGLDINHRPIALLDAYRPGFICHPAYHALHHVHPDAYFSAYGKFVDWTVGGGAALAGRRLACAAPPTPFATELCALAGAAGCTRQADVSGPSDPALASLDVLVLPDPALSTQALIEGFITAASGRQMPPEVWVVSGDAENALARHYCDDVRVIHRTIVARLAMEPGRAAARVAMFFIRRGAHFVPTTIDRRLWSDFRAFRHTRPLAPTAAPGLRSRDDYAAAVAPPG